MTARVLVIDNRDPFLYTLLQYFGELGAESLVRANDAISAEEVASMDPDRLVISGGAGWPSDAGTSNSILHRLWQQTPVLGICLGLLCIGEVFGGRVVRAKTVIHGKTVLVHHTSEGLFSGLDSPFEAACYYSLVLDRSSLPDTLEITAETEDGVIMGARHRLFPVEGVHFRPESLLTTRGRAILANFLDRPE